MGHRSDTMGRAQLLLIIASPRKTLCDSNEDTLSRDACSQSNSWVSPLSSLFLIPTYLNKPKFLKEVSNCYAIQTACLAPLT